MKKLLYQGQNNVVRTLTHNWFTVLSGAVLSVLFIISSVALLYSDTCIMHNGQKVCYLAADD